MTHISTYKTKKAFKKAVKERPSQVHLIDPSMFKPITGVLTFIMSKTNDITVTNHPKRSWFASVTNGKNGLVVK